MTIKQLAIIIDDFSSNSVPFYGNVTFYDFGSLSAYREWDYYLDNNFQIDGYGDADYFEPILPVIGPRFFPVKYDSTTEWKAGVDIDFSGDAGTGIGNGGYTSYWSDYFIFRSYDTEGSDALAHGDWVLKAFQDQLTAPENVEIVLIDIDKAQLSLQFDALFDPVSSAYTSNGVASQLEHIVLDWFNTESTKAGAADNIFVPTTLSASISGTLPSLEESLSLNWLASNDVAIVQAAPNVGQGYFDWGSIFADVINVGAWNIDANDQILAAAATTLGTVDILANGYIQSDIWGSNFGTSFATPRVAAEFVNTWDQAIQTVTTAIENGELSVDDLYQDYGIQYSDILDFLIQSASEEVFVEINDTWLDYPVRLLTTDYETTLYPVAVTDLPATGLNGIYFTDVSATDPSISPTDTGSGTGTGSGTEQPSDATAPELTALAFTVEPTTEGGYDGLKITATATIKDDLSGNAGEGYTSSPSQIRLVSPSGQQSFFMMLSGYELLSGNANNGVYQDIEILPEFSESGTWTIDHVLLVDQVGNLQWLREADLVEAGLPTSVEINTNQPADTTPPELTSLAFAVKATNEGGYDGLKITATATITDDLSGNAGEGYTSSPSQIRLVSPSGQQSFFMMLSGYDLLSGNANNGVYQDVEILPEFSESGTWTIDHVLLVDQVGNLQWLREADLVEAGLPTSVEINTNQPADTTPPELTSLSFVVEANNEGGYDGLKITAAATITDDLSGNAGTGYSSSPSQIRLVSPSGQQFVDLLLSGNELISGNSINGVYKDTKILPEFAESGNWTIDHVLLADQVGNMQRLDEADLIEAGLPTNIYVALESSTVVHGTETADELTSSADLSNLFGYGGNDVLRTDPSTSGNRLNGGSGDDTLIGGGRSDVAVFSGQRSDYDLEYVDGNVLVKDLNGTDGTDVLQGINLIEFSDRTEFYLMASDRVALSGSVSEATVLVDESKLYNGTRMAETFVIEPKVSAFIMAGDGDRVVLPGDFSDYDFEQLGSQLHVSNSGYSTFVNVGGEVLLETDAGSADVHIAFEAGQPVIMLGEQNVGSSNFDIDQVTIL